MSGAGNVNVGISYQGVEAKKLTVPLSVAKEELKNDGQKQIFVNSDGEDLVISGKNLSVDNLSTGDKITSGGKSGIVTFVDNEANSFWEGAAEGIKSTIGVAGTVGTAIIGGGLGALSGFSIYGGGAWKPGPGAIKGAAIGATIALGVSAVVGGIKALSSEAGKAEKITQ